MSLSNRFTNQKYSVLSATKTATGQDAGVGLGGPAAFLVFNTNVTAASGTTPSLTVKLQDSLDGGVSWADITGATTASLTTTGNSTIRVTAPIGDMVRAVWTITGTTPSFTFTVDAWFLR